MEAEAAEALFAKWRAWMDSPKAMDAADARLFMNGTWKEGMPPNEYALDLASALSYYAGYRAALAAKETENGS